MWWLLAISSVDTWTKDMDKDAKFLHCEEHVSKRCALCKCAVFAKHVDIWMNRMDKDDRFLEYVSKRCVLRTLFLPDCRETWPKIHGQSGRGTIAKCNEPLKNVKEGRQGKTSISGSGWCCRLTWVVSLGQGLVAPPCENTSSSAQGRYSQKV